MGYRARPTTTTLKKVIMEYFPRPQDETEPDAENHAHDHEIGCVPEPAREEESCVHDRTIGREPEHTRDDESRVHDHEIRHEPEPSFQRDIQEGKSGVHVHDDEMQRESESSRKASPEGVFGEYFYGPSTEILTLTLLDIGDTDAKNSNDTNDTDDTANDTCDRNDPSDTDNIENQEETVITVLRNKAEMDPELSTGFKKCCCSKNKKLSDYETLQNYFFVVDFKNKWYERRVMVKVRVIFVGDNDLFKKYIGQGDSCAQE
jgi:hypothetical protein